MVVVKRIKFDYVLCFFSSSPPPGRRFPSVVSFREKGLRFSGIRFSSFLLFENAFVTRARQVSYVRWVDRDFALCPSVPFIVRPAFAYPSKSLQQKIFRCHNENPNRAFSQTAAKIATACRTKGDWGVPE